MTGLKLASARGAGPLPRRAGVGFKPEHFAAILAGPREVGFFEVHAETYMGDGGPPHRRLEAIRARYPLSLHGVGLSIGSPRPLDRDHLARLKGLIRRYEPAQFSEHLAWSSHDEGFLADLLPLPYDDETLAVVCRHIDETQEALGDAHAAREPVDLRAVFRQRDRRDRIPRRGRRAAPAAACCSTSTTSSSARPTTASTRSPISPPSRFAMSAKSISPATPTRSTTKARRC